MIDNCYCEFVSYKEPTEVGADVAVGSLIKNLGGGITPNGAYIVGKKDLINLVAERLTVPGQGKEVGPSLGFNKQILQGLFLAPLVVANSLKTAIFTSKIMETLGYDVEPKYNEERVDIVQNIIFNINLKNVPGKSYHLKQTYINRSSGSIYDVAENAGFFILPKIHHAVRKKEKNNMIVTKV